MLLGLPNELILLITTFLSRNSLLCLANSCRRLHYLAVCIYFTRHNIDITSRSMTLSYTDGTIRALPGLATSLVANGRTLVHLACYFNININSPLGKVKDVMEFKRFVAKLSSVQHVRISLVTPLHRIWEEVLLELLDLVMQKFCTSLHLTTTLYSSRDALARKIHSPSRPSFTRPFFRPRSSLVSQPQSLQICRISQLPYFLQPWYIQVLNSGVIHELSFKSIMLHENGGSFFGNLELPQLTHLSIRLSSLGHGSLSRFLTRHPSITSVEFLDNNFTPSSFPRLPSRAFRQLKVLKTSSEHLVHVFRDLSSFKSLETVEIVAGVYFANPEPALAALKSLPNSITLTLSLKCDAGFEDWLRLRPWQSSDSFIERKLQCIRSLEINTCGERGYRFATAVLATFTRWFALFPALENISFTRHSLAPSVDSAYKTAFALSLKDACLRLKTLYLVSDVDWYQQVRDGG